MWKLAVMIIREHNTMTTHSYMKFFFLGLIAFLLTGCTHYYYMPNVQNVPAFREKNEYRLCGTMGGTDGVNTTELQGAYSVSDNMGLIGNFMAAKGGSDTSGNWGRGNYYEIGVGYFKPLTDVLTFETYMGAGTGNETHQYSKSGERARLELNRFFIQPSLAVSFKYLDVIVSARACKLDFNAITEQGSIPVLQKFNLDTISMNPHSFLFEPALTLRTGYKYFKVQLQFQTSSNMDHPNLKLEHGNINLGIYLSLAPRFKQKRALN